MRVLWVGLVASSAVASGKLELVLSVKDGDSVEWVQPYASKARVTAYNKGQALNIDAISEVALPNVGREAHAFLYHIVNRFDSLAEKTVFMPGGLPTQGFRGFAQSGASLLPGVKLEDYLTLDAAELMIPTMALSSDLKQFSMRMSLMDNTTEAGLEGAQHFRVCTHGLDGWSPFLPNKFASSVLEPLMTQQHAKWNFRSFWTHYMSGVPVPERVLAAHGAIFSVSRQSVRSHPKAFYEALLTELEGSKDPYQAFFLDLMWWYVFHGNKTALCDTGLMPQGLRKSASRQLERRKLASVYTVIEPHAGQSVDYGSTINIAWSCSTDGFQRVELWRYGSYVTRLYDSMYGYANHIKQVNWHVEPGPNYDSAENKTGTKTMHSLRPSSSGEKTWYHFVRTFTPGDKYTVRVCAYSLDPEQQICDDTYGESGEFAMKATIDMLSPVQSNYYKPGDFVPITWQSYYGSVKQVDLKIYFQGHSVYKKENTDDDGVFTFFVPPDMKAGVHTIEVSEPGTDCKTASCRTSFTVLAHASPPPSPPSPPPSPPSPPVPGDWEVPIIQAFKGSFGLDEIQTGPGPGGSVTSYTSTVSSNLNCNYVCHVYDTSNGIVGGRGPSGGRRLLFGGLQYYDPVDTNAFVGCSEDMRKCNCCSNPPSPP